MPDLPASLDELLRDYPAPPPLATDFKIQVQRRLAAADPWWHRLERTFAQPAFAAVFVCACVLLGLLLAEMRLGAERARTHARVVESYLLLINPRLDARDDPPATGPAAQRPPEVPS